MNDVEGSANEQVEERMRHMAEQIASLQKDNLRLTRELERAGKVSTLALELHYKAGWNDGRADIAARIDRVAPKKRKRRRSK